MPVTIIVRLIQLVLTSSLTANDIGLIIKAALLAAEDIKAGNFTGAADAIAANLPEALPVVETAANLLFPGAGNAIDMLVHLTGNLHRLTPADEKAMFDRQNPTAGL
jgi:hypothetical protein